MIDAVAMLSPGVTRTAGRDEPKDQTEFFARVLAKGVRSALSVWGSVRVCVWCVTRADKLV